MEPCLGAKLTIESLQDSTSHLDGQERIFHAHSANPHGQWHRLRDHLCAVSDLASRFAGNSPWAQEAALAGLLHDLGKYADRFQERLEGRDAGLDHWSQGAWIALSQHRSIAAALSIQGHHVGLQRCSLDALRSMSLETLSNRHPFHLQLSDQDAARLLQRAREDGIRLEAPKATAISLQQGFAKAVAAMLDVRMLFSCLVDADFLDTEAHFNGDANGKRARPAGIKLDPKAGIDALNGYMNERIRAGAIADAQVLAAREALWRATEEAAQKLLGSSPSRRPQDLARHSPCCASPWSMLLPIISSESCWPSLFSP